MDTSTRRFADVDLLGVAGRVDHRSAADLERQFNRYPKAIRKAAQASYTASRQ